MAKGTKGNKGTGKGKIDTKVSIVENVENHEVDIDADSANMGGNVEALSLAKAQAEMKRASDWVFDSMAIDKLIPADKVLKFVINTESETVLRRNCKGYFNPEAYQDSKTGEIIGVINIVPEMFNPDYDDKPLKQRLLQTIIHEMTHAVNSLNGIVDCTKNAHNKKFAVTAELAGLIATKGTKSQGWGKTELSEQSYNLIEHGFEFDLSAFEIFARDLKGKAKIKKATPQPRWQCPECEQGFRTQSKEVFNIACMDCSLIDDSGSRKGILRNIVKYIKVGGEKESTVSLA